MKTASLARRWNARAGVLARYASSSLASIMAVLCAGGPAPDARGVPPDAVSPPLPASVDSWKDMLDRDRASAARQAGPEQAQEAPLRALDAPPDGPPDATFQTAPRAAAGATPAPAPQTPTNGFQAITRQQQLADTSTWWYPPDTMGAVGTNHFVEAINGSVAVYVKATGSRLSHVTLNSFFTATIAGTNYPRNGSFDPRILYDRRSQRWFATALERGSPSGSNNHVLLAVSATADPTGSWYKYVVPVGIPPSGSVTNFSDFETLGTDDNGVYVGVRIFPTLSATHAKIAAMQKAPLLSGTASTVYQWTSITDMYSTPQPVHNLDPVAAGDRAWFVASSPSANADVRYRRLTWSGGVPTLDGSSTTLTTPSFSAVKNAPALGSTVAINVGDARLQMAAIRGGRLWTCRNVAVNSAGGSTSADRTGCEWLQLDVSGGTPSLVQSGRVYDTTSPNPRFYY